MIRPYQVIVHHQPAPPPGHPREYTYGWPGGGAGWCRLNLNQIQFKNGPFVE